MGKLVVWNIVSLDGYFEGTEKWDLALHEHIWGDDLYALSRSIGDDLGLLVLGRVTYEGFVAHWPDDSEQPDIAAYMNATPKLVASRTLTETSWQNTEIASDIVAELTRRKPLDDRPVYVFGSATLTASLLDAGLVDELLIAIAPVILGEGTPLFPEGRALTPLTLLESRPLDTGGVLMRYAVA